MFPILKWNYLKEKDFQSALNKELKKQWHYVYKFPDTWYAQKPYDCIFLNKENWITYHCELKLISGITININKLEPQQHYYLDFISSINNELALVLIRSKKFNSYKWFRYKDFMSMKNEKGWVKVF